MQRRNLTPQERRNNIEMLNQQAEYADTPNGAPRRQQHHAFEKPSFLTRATHKAWGYFWTNYQYNRAMKRKARAEGYPKQRHWGLILFIILFVVGIFTVIGYKSNLDSNNAPTAPAPYTQTRPQNQRQSGRPYNQYRNAKGEYYNDINDNGGQQ